MGRTLSIRRRGRKPCSLPTRLLVTDAVRLADPLPAVCRLKPGDGVLFRHYELAPARRLALGLQVARICRQRGLLLLVAGDARLASRLGADGLHLPQKLIRPARRLGTGLMTAAAHDAGAIRRARQAGADAVLISPVFATASHPGASPLGVIGFARLASLAAREGLQVYALGGVTETAMRRLGRVPAAAGFAAITGLSKT